MANEHGEGMHSSDSVEIVESGGCLRFDSRWGYPRVHVNSTHASVGIRSVSIDKEGNLEVIHDSPGPIVTMWADSDETMIGRQITAGCSGGGGRTKIKLYDNRDQRYLDLNVGRDWLRLHDRWSNLWVGWKHLKGNP